MTRRRTRSAAGRPPGAGIALAAVALAALAAVPAQAQSPSFVARADRAQVAYGESVIVEVTLSIDDGRVDGYHAPDVKGGRILGEMPSQSTQIQMGGGRTFSQTVYNWRYEIEPSQKGTLTVGAARVRVGGKELRTSPLTITVREGPGPGARRVPSPGAGASPLSPFSQFPFGAEPQAGGGSGGQNFLRAVASKTRVYLGEQITVEWFLYLTERQDKYQTVTEPRAEGFWSEDIPVPTSQRGLQLTRQEHEGQTYLVAPLLRRALFPLQVGRLTITPMESEISQVDFFGSTLRTQKLKTEPLAIEVLALPTAGQPRGFDPAAVGRFTMGAKVDRERVAVGEAVTLTLTIAGQGNVRKLPPPPLDRLDGWKLYDPKISVALEPGEAVSGTKTVEYLLLPERAGVTIIPAFVLPFFDPAARSYVHEKTAPLRIEVVGERGGAPAPGGGGAGTGGARPGPATGAPGGAENVLGIDIRPLRARPTLRRDLGTTFYRSSLFTGVLVAPPVAFGLTLLVGRVRERMGKETEGGRRRKLRRLARRRLGAAEKHLEDGQTTSFFIEIDRVLREFLAGKLGRPVTGMPRDELRAHLTAAGLGHETIDRTIDALEECDRARFAPGSVGEGEMRACLERAAEIIERTPVGGRGA
jgi:hypothetical protein